MITQSATRSKASLMSPPGPMLTTCVLQQVVSFLGYTGRAANVVATAAFDPEETFAPALGCQPQVPQQAASSEITLPHFSVRGTEGIHSNLIPAA
jgi:hypothetical protein